MRSILNAASQPGPREPTDAECPVVAEHVRGSLVACPGPVRQ